MARSELIRPLPELLRLHAERRGARTAFADATRTVSYAELERRTGRLAGHLADAGLSAGARVLIMLGNSVAVIESYLAAVRASAVAVPVAPQSSDAELAHILQDSGAVCVITDGGHIDQLRRVAGRRDDLIVVLTGAEPVPSHDLFRVLRFDELATTTPATPARDDLGLDDVAWMLYTSGTTGRPKGVLSSQRNCLWSVAACYVPVLGLSPEDKVLWPLPLFHSLAHILCLHGVVAAGAMARIVDGFAADEILQLLRAEPYTFLVGVPTMYRYLINEARHAGLHTAALRICLVTGAVTAPALSKSFEDTFGIRLIDSYGSTETCGAITMNRSTGAQVPGSCGRPAPGLKVRVVDPDTGGDVRAGAEGEVWVSGPNVMIGYHGQPEASAAALTDGWYRTGDLARRDDLGYLTITGRIKELIIRAGENIHPAEVEEAVRTVNGVADVAVVAKPHDDLGEVPVAFVVAENPGVVGTERIFAACRERLSHFKVPEEVYEISEMPRTASGKIARHRLLEQPARFCAARDAKQESLFRVDWVPVPAGATAAPEHWAVVGGDGWGDVPVFENLDALAVALDGGAQAPGVVLAPLGSRGVDDASALLDAWLADARFADARLVLVTRGAVSVGGEDVANLAHAPVWGLVRSARADQPDRFGLLDLLDEDVSGDAVCALAADEPELAVRNGVFRAPRLATVNASAESVAVWDQAGTVLLVGASAGVAGSVAKHLAVVHHVRHLLFVETGTHSAELESDLVRIGAEPVFTSCDMTDRDAVAQLLENARGPLTAVVHAADTAVSAAHLHELTRDLRVFLVFSAADSLLGLAQHREHAQTAAFLHALAQHRHAQGQPAVAVAWGPELSEEDNMALLDAAVATPEPFVLAMRLNLESIRGRENTGDLAAWLRRPPGNPMAQADPASGLRARLAGMSSAERKRLVLQLVHGEAVAVTGNAGLRRHTPDRAFSELGFTSITAVQLRNRLAAATGLALPTTLVFDYPNPAVLAEHLVAELTGNRTGVVSGTASAYIDEPIAIVAMSCRYPGEIRSPEDLWRLVESGGDGISGFPADRGWDLERLYDPERSRQGTAYVRTGGFLHDAGEFDAAFFGISPREALAMDPQQRLLLETSWEVFERAGISPVSMRGSRTGVFAGVMFHDYASRLRRMPEGVEGYVDTGNAGSVVSGRVAYTLGLEGPAVTVDTACSSSLVALHLACQALRHGECTMALAGGVTVMASPGPFVEFSRQGGLAPDGRCKPFSGAADGTSFAEGVGVLLVERLSDARRNGHPVLAIVRGTAINQDGASNGLTAPNGPSQQRLVLEALAKAGLRADDIDVVEAHGTGTTLGDPIEAQALLATYGQGRDRPLWLGSVKSNLGHTQAAAGVAGVIKMVMAMRHGVLPKTLHADEPSPHVDWSSGSVRLLATPMAWTTDGPRRAGVSSFGISGTNAHAILEEAAPADRSSTEDEAGQAAGPVPWVLSAKDDAAVRAQAGRLAERVTSADLGAAEVGFSLATSRSTFAHRLVVVGEDRDRLLTGVQAFARDGSPTGTVVQGLAQSDSEPVFVFPGQGAQWVGMGRELLRSSPVFRGRAEECDEALRSFTGWSVLDVLRDAPGAEPLDRVDVVQPALFTVMVSLAEVWRSFGVVPAAVVGHSQGEIAAAYVSGALSLEDAARVVALRSKAWLSLAGRGGMLSVSLPAEQVVSRLARWGDRLSVAAVNSPGSVAVSGDPEALDELLAEVHAEGAKARRIPGVDTAGHSAQVDVLRDELLAALAPLRPRPAAIPFYSTVTGGLLGADTLMDTHYWYRNIREPVEFERAVRSLIADGHSSFVEVSAHPMLAGALQETAEDTGTDIGVSGTLRRDDGGTERFLVSLAEAFVRGASVDWPVAFAATGARIVELPTYPFQRRRYWLESADDLADVGAAGLDTADHPLLSAITALAGGDGLLGAARLSRQTHGWLADHGVVPASAFVEMAMRSGDEVGCDHIDELVIEAPLVLPERGGVRLQLVVDGPDDGGRRTISVYARGEDSGQPWTRHATGMLTARTVDSHPVSGSWPPADATPMDLQDGAAVQAWQRGGEIYVEVTLAEEQEGDAARFGVHPALLEPALEIVGGTRLPLRWQGVTLRATGATSLLVRLSPTGPDAFALTCFDPAGQLVLAAESVTFNPAPGEHTQRAVTRKSLFRVAWTELPANAVNAPDAVIVDVPSPAGEDIVAAAHTSVRRLLTQVQTWLADDHRDAPRLAVLTRNAIATGLGDPSPDLAVSPVWGLVRSAQSENPGRFVLIDTDGTEASQQQLQAALASGEPQVAIRSGSLFVPRLTRMPITDFSPPESGTVLVTGGAGTLGGLVARHLVRTHAVRHLVLAGRQGMASAGAEQLAAELTELGAEVVFAACDVADRDELARVIAAIPSDRPLTGVVHAAGTIDDGVCTDLTPDQLERVLLPKVDGAMHLHELTRDMNLSMFVLFSSVAATLGTPGQANYAAANAFLDALAQRRRAEGLPAVAVAWGLWHQRSQLTERLTETDIARLARTGAHELATEEALALFDAAQAADDATLVAVHLDTAGLRAQAESGTLPAMLRGLVRQKAQTGKRVGGSALAQRLTGLSDAERHDILLDLVRRQTAAVLGHADAATVDPARAFKELGIDSLTALELRNRLAAATEIRLPATLVFDFPSISAVAIRLRDELIGAAAPSGPVMTTRPADDDPIAIVAMSCRYPGGVESPDDLWRLLADGGDAISAFPADRGWDVAALYHPDADRPGTTYTREGGFLDRAGEFDAAFFGISPREALAMDPQQRLLLEVCWEALERAGIDAATMRGSSTGVFAGTNMQDYSAFASSVPPADEGYLLTNTVASVLSGRVAYTFGFEGPAISVDTACSSSLVAIHLATQSLRQGECALALAGGVTVLATPQSFVAASRQQVLARDGRCKAFADDADGFGMAEGAGVLLLERLSDARRNGHPVLAVVRGSAVNQDGASNGLTAPNGPAQERVIRQALLTAGLQPSDVDAVEAHGTGTALGDPIEAQALLATYGQDRPADRPLRVGSVKSNIGHTLAAAGVAGVIKTVLSIRNDILPKTLHVDTPTSHVDWSAGAVSLLAEPVEWQQNGHPRRAGVSSFGISGTNAHMILEEPPPQGISDVTPEQDPPGLVPLALSARTAPAVRAQAARLRDWLAESDLSPVDVGFSLLSSRSVFEHRAVVLGPGRAELVRRLGELADGVPSPSIVHGVAKPAGKVAFLLSGQGSQRVEMGRELYAAHPVFAKAFDEVCDLLDVELGRSLRDVVFERAGVLNETAFAQAGLFALEVALFRLVESWGVRPDFLIGHSLGEVTAACLAGVWSLEQACALVATRGWLMQASPSGGAMMSVQATESDVRALLAGRGSAVDIAAVNGPEAVVISGDEDIVAEVAGALTERGRKTKRLRVSHAFHSAHMEPMLEEFRQFLDGLSYAPPAIPIIANLTGRPATPAEICTADYWVRQVREPVRFMDGIRWLRDEGKATAFLELGPGGVLTAAAHECVSDIAVAVPALRRDQPEEEAVLTALSALHVNGAPVGWAKALADRGARRVDLPTYPFQRRHYWLDAPSGATAGPLDSLRYRIAWRAAPEAPTPALRGVWIVAVPGNAGQDPWASAAVSALTEHGALVVPIELGPSDIDRDRLAERLRTTAGDHQVAGVLSLLALDGQPMPDHQAVPVGLALTVALLQALTDWGLEAPLWCATNGAASEPVQAQLWGLGRVVALEHPSVWGGLVDLPAVLDTRARRRFAGVLSVRSEDQVTIRDTGVFVRRLERHPSHQVPAVRRWQPNGTALVTGGTGAVGGHVARWLARHGAEHLILVSRRGEAAPGALELERELTELGARVTLAACDVADRAALARVLEAVPGELPLRTVVHAAGIVDDGVLDSLTPDRLSAVFASKAVAARHLHELTSEADLSAFILFSGMAGTLGAAGQGSYAAANAYLDALAAGRRAAGLPATSIAWGWWDAGGMSTSNPEAMQRLRRSGVIPMPPDRALAALQQTLDRDETDVCLADTDWELFARTFTATKPSPLIAELVSVRAEDAEEPLVRLPADPAERDRVVLDLVRTHTSQVLRGSLDDLDVQRGFLDSGFDSLTAVELRNRLTAATGLALPSSLIFDHPTPLALARHLCEALALHGTSADGREAEVRAALASIPIKRIEEAGLMVDLLRLAGDPGAPQRRDEPGSIDEMDVSDLVQLAREARESR